jgi:uncharacterized protein (TIGR02757 family)
LVKKEKTLLQGLEGLYKKYNRREFVHPDPLEFLYDFPDPGDREIVALLAACLAYGRVWQILKSITGCLEITGSAPRDFLLNSGENHLKKAFEAFNYRFVRGPEMARFMIAVKRAIERCGGLEPLFSARGKACSGRSLSGPEGTVARLKGAVDGLLRLAELPRSYLLPDPAKKSACKRLFLFLRWMVRKDRVDPGGWTVISPADLVIPLDTHMFYVATELGFTGRKQADMAAALEITGAFSRINPSDPVKYDFVLTRFGIRDELSRDDVTLILVQPDQ